MTEPGLGRWQFYLPGQHFFQPQQCLRNEDSQIGQLAERVYTEAMVLLQGVSLQAHVYILRSA